MQTIKGGFVIRAEQQPVHEMSDPNDEQFKRGGGNVRDEGRWKGIITPDTVGNANMIMGIYSLKPGETHLLHYHENAAEFYYILSGAGSFTIGEEVVRGEPGVTLYMPAKVNHAITNDGDEDLSMMFCFDCGDLKDAKMVWVPEKD